VGPDQIAAVLRRLADPQEAAAELVRRANEGGGRDNVTVLVVDVVDDGGVAEAASGAVAARRSHLESHGDLAGFSTAITDEPTDRPAPKAASRPSRSERRSERRARRASRSRVTWRVLAFAVLLVAVIGGAFATIQWYGTSTYFVAFDGDEVAIYQGRPGGLLWIDPTLQDDTGIRRDEVPARYLSALEAGHEHSSLAQAQRYVSNIERDIAAAAEAGAATTTTTTAPPTTVAPADTVAPPAN
jgi:protein phosphatase